MGQIHATIFFTLFKSLYIDTRCLEQLPATLSSLENHCMMIFEKIICETKNNNNNNKNQRKKGKTTLELVVQRKVPGCPNNNSQNIKEAFLRQSV